MNTFEVGQKVTTPFGPGVIFDTNASGSMYHVELKDGLTKWFWESYLKPYKTPHERLLELGWIMTHDLAGRYYTMTIPNTNLDEVSKGKKDFTKTLVVTTKYFTANFAVDEELTKVLADYLELIKDIKWLRGNIL